MATLAAVKRKNPWRLAGTSAVSLLVLAGLLLLLVNLYVQSAGVQGRLHRELGAALRMPVEIRKTTFTPWDGLRIDGIRAAPADGGEGVRLSAESFRARLAFWPLISERRFVVRDVLFDRPALAWTQTPEGHWRWPSVQLSLSDTAQDDSSVVAGEDVNNATGSSDDPDSADPAPPAEAAPPAVTREEKTSVARSHGLPIPLAVRDFRVRNGRLEFRDRFGTPVGRFENVDAEGALVAPDRGQSKGNIRLARAAWGAGGTGDALAVDRFAAPFSYDGETLRLPNGRGKLAGGDVHLDGSLRPLEPGTPFETHGELTGVPLDVLLRRAGLRLDLAAGQLAGNFSLAGLAAQQDTHVGQGQLSLTGGELRGVPLLSTLGEALGIEDLRRLQLDDAHANCRLTGPDLHLDSLVLAARNLRVEAQGDAQLDRAGSRGPNGLDMRGRLILNRAITRQLPQFVENNLTPVPDSPDGARYLDFRVAGPVNNPHTDLLDRALGKQSLRGMLEGFFGGGGGGGGGSGSGKEKKKKNNDR